MSGDAHPSSETGAVGGTTHQQQSADTASSSARRTSAGTSAGNDTSSHQHHQLLPDILGQLRLVPNRPLIKLPADDYPNPFQLYAAASEASPSAVTSASTTSSQRTRRTSDTTGTKSKETTIRDQLFGPKCCGCSVTPSSSVRRSHKSAEHSILHPKQFKQRSTNDGVPIGAVGAGGGGNNTHDRRRVVLRQPQLRLLEQCLQHGLTRSCASTVDRPESPVPTAIAAAAAPTPPQPSSTSTSAASASTSSLPSSQPPRRSVQERLQRGHRNWNPRENQFVDFRSLLTGCENLSLSVGSVLPAEHRSRAFRQLQQHPHPNHQHSHSTMHARQLSRLKSSLKATTSIKAPRSRSEDRVYSGRSGESETAAAAAAAAASSCSQQALLNQTTVTTSATAAATECDVTIDELASYFETFVHIPKKMSSMAEMMYI